MSHLSGTYVIWGPPGTGKTRFLADQVDKIVKETPARVDGTGPVVVSSLTRAAAAEIASRKLPIPDWQVGTLHALAYRMLGRPPIAETLVEEWNKYKPEYAVEEDSASGDVDDMPVEHGSDHSMRGRNLHPGTDLYSEYSLLRAQVQDRDTWKPTVKNFAAAWEDWKKAVGCIDFSDMIEFALKDVGVAPGNPDVIIADECLSGDAMVALSDGTRVSIREIVEEKRKVDVMCFDHSGERVVSRRITGWHKVPRRGRAFCRIGKLMLTEDHPVFSPQEGYIQVNKLVDLCNVHGRLQCYETIQQERRTDTKRALNNRRFPFGRCFDQAKHGKSWERPCVFYARRSTTRLPLVEVRGASAVVPVSSVASRNNGVWWTRLQAEHTDSSGIYGDLRCYSSDPDWPETGHGSSPAMDRRVGSFRLVHGRRKCPNRSSGVLDVCIFKAKHRASTPSPCRVGLYHTRGVAAERYSHTPADGADEETQGSDRTIPSSDPCVQVWAAEAENTPPHDSRLHEAPTKAVRHLRARVLPQKGCYHMPARMSEGALSQTRSGRPGAFEDSKTPYTSYVHNMWQGLREANNDGGLDGAAPHVFPCLQSSAGSSSTKRCTTYENPNVYVRVLQRDVQDHEEVAAWKDVPVLLSKVQGPVGSGRTPGEGSCGCRAMCDMSVCIHGLSSRLEDEGAKDLRGPVLLEHVGQPESEEEYVYCLDVEEHHNFFADDILVHNCQDYSKREYELLASWSKQAEALMLAGDAWQALYVWRGADPSIFTDPSIPDTHRRILSQSYRVPRVVQELAKRWVTNLSDYSPIDYKPRDEEGQLLTSDANWRKPEALVDRIVKLIKADETVMICATCSYMLRPTVEVLKKNGIPFCNPWRAKRRDWNPLRASRGVSVAQRVLDFLRVDAASFPKDAEEVYMRGRFWNYDELRNWASILKAADLMQRGAKGLLNRWATEKKTKEVWPDDMWKVFMEVGVAGLGEALGMDEGKTEAMLTWLQEHLLDSKRKGVHYPVEVVRRFGARSVVDNMRPRKDDGKPHVYVGTIHSFKGSEASNVIIFPDLSPAGNTSWRSAKGRDGVVRTFYVGITRAKKTVTVCQASGQFKVQLMGLIGEVLAKPLSGSLSTPQDVGIC